MFSHADDGEALEVGKPQRVMATLEPIRPLSTFVYKCDSRFHTEPLWEMLTMDERFAFAVVDGTGGLFAAVQGNSRRVLHSFSASLPSKTRRGGQSSARFGRLREEAVGHLVTKIAELLTKLFIDPHTNLPNARGLVLAGNAHIKNKVFDSKALDPRVKAIVVGIVDVAYNGNQGLNQAIELSEGALDGVTLIRHKKLFSQFFGEIATDSGRYAFGHRDVFSALEQGAVETLIVWENFNLVMHKFLNRTTQESGVVFCRPGEQPIALAIAASPVPLDASSIEILTSLPVVDYLVENHVSFGAKIELVQDASPEGSQFCKGFGGLGALLRYRLDFSCGDDETEDETEQQEEQDLEFM